MGKSTLKSNKRAKAIEPIFAHVAGIDIGSRLIHVAAPNEQGEIEVREFGSTTPQLQEIVAWLLSEGVDTAAMEATGVYWIPLFETLRDAGIRPALVDPKAIKNVPGKKTDVLDAQWIQSLYAHGLLRDAHRPLNETLRAFLRQRDNLIKVRSEFILRMQKAMQLMNIRLETVVSDIIGVTGMDIIRMIIAGERDPVSLAELRNHRCKRPPQDFVDALTGNFQETHLVALRQGLEAYDFLGSQLDELDKFIEAELLRWEDCNKPVLINKPPKKKQSPKGYERSRVSKKNSYTFDLQKALYLATGKDLTVLPGISEHTAAVIIGELGGADVNAFKSQKHFASWLGLCPGNNISGGRSHGGRSKKCFNRIKQALCMAVMTIGRSKSALGAYYRRMKARLGALKAIKAAAHKLAILVYQLIKTGEDFVELGQQEYERRFEERRIKGLKKAAKELGFELTAVNKPV